MAVHVGGRHRIRKSAKVCFELASRGAVRKAGHSQDGKSFISSILRGTSCPAKWTPVRQRCSLYVRRETNVKIQRVKPCASQDFTSYWQRGQDFFLALLMTCLARLYVFHVLSKTNEANLGGWTCINVISHFYMVQKISLFSATGEWLVSGTGYPALWSYSSGWVWLLTPGVNRSPFSLRLSTVYPVVWGR